MNNKRAFEEAFDCKCADDNAVPRKKIKLHQTNAYQSKYEVKLASLINGYIRSNAISDIPSALIKLMKTWYGDPKLMLEVAFQCNIDEPLIMECYFTEALCNQIFQIKEYQLSLEDCISDDINENIRGKPIFKYDNGKQNIFDINDANNGHYMATFSLYLNKSDRFFGNTNYLICNFKLCALDSDHKMVVKLQKQIQINIKTNSYYTHLDAVIPRYFNNCDYDIIGWHRILIDKTRLFSNNHKLILTRLFYLLSRKWGKYSDQKTIIRKDIIYFMFDAKRIPSNHAFNEIVQIFDNNLFIYS